MKRRPGMERWVLREKKGPVGRFLEYVLYGSYRYLWFLLFLGILVFALWMLFRAVSPLLLTLLKIGLGLFLLVNLATEYYIIKGSRPRQDAGADTLLVLGAGVFGRKPSRSLVDRLEEAKRYLERNPKARCVLCGGQGFGEDVSEARCMADWLMARGVEGSRLILEDSSTDTYENLRNAYTLLGDSVGRPAVLTSDYHVMRSLWISRDLGHPAVGVAARTDRRILRLNYYLREVAGVWKYLILEKYLGGRKWTT